MFYQRAVSSPHLVLGGRVGLHARHVGLDAVQLRVRVARLLLQVRDLLVQAEHAAPGPALALVARPRPEAGLEVAAVLEHAGAHGEAGLHAARLVAVGVGAARGAATAGQSVPTLPS